MPSFKDDAGRNNPHLRRYFGSLGVLSSRIYLSRIYPCGKHSSRTARGFGESSAGAADRVTHFTGLNLLTGSKR
jgi:hypothetical protein